MPNSPRVIGDPPKLLVCTASQPAREIEAVNFPDEIRAALVEDLGAVLVPPEIALYIEIARLHLRSHRAIAQQHAVGKIVEKMGHIVLRYAIRLKQRAGFAARMPSRWQIATIRSARLSV